MWLPVLDKTPDLFPFDAQMDLFIVTPPFCFITKGCITLITLKGFCPRMVVFVDLEFGRHSETFTADITRVWPFHFESFVDTSYVMP